MGDFMGRVRQFPDFQGKSIRSARWYIGLGWIFAILSMFVIPILFGVLGTVMGIIASKKGHKGGITVIVASILMMVIGILAGTILNTFLKIFLGVFLISNA